MSKPWNWYRVTGEVTIRGEYEIHARNTASAMRPFQDGLEAWAKERFPDCEVAFGPIGIERLDDDDPDEPVMGSGAAEDDWTPDDASVETTLAEFTRPKVGGDDANDHS